MRKKIIVRERTLGSIVLILAFCHQAMAEATDPGVKGFEAAVTRARPLDLTGVRLLGGPLKQAQDVTARYLLTLEPDRMMAGYRVRAGLEPKAEGYGGW